MLNTPDPFRELKDQGNAEAIAVCREVRPRISSFRDFVLASVIGNTFDYGVKGHTVTTNFSTFFRQEFAKGLVIDDTERILPLTGRVVYLSDNCGEIVFDRLLIQFLKSRGSHVTLAVKARPRSTMRPLMMRECSGLTVLSIVSPQTARAPRSGSILKRQRPPSKTPSPIARLSSQKEWQILNLFLNGMTSLPLRS